MWCDLVDKTCIINWTIQLRMCLDSLNNTCRKYYRIWFIMFILRNILKRWRIINTSLGHWRSSSNNHRRVIGRNSRVIQRTVSIWIRSIKRRIDQGVEVKTVIILIAMQVIWIWIEIVHILRNTSTIITVMIMNHSSNTILIHNHNNSQCNSNMDLVLRINSKRNIWERIIISINLRKYKINQWNHQQRRNVVKKRKIRRNLRKRKEECHHPVMIINNSCIKIRNISKCQRGGVHLGAGVSRDSKSRKCWRWRRRWSWN